MTPQQIDSKLAYASYQQAEGFTIHMLTSETRSFLTNAYLIETDNAVVAIDTFMIVSDAEALLKLIGQIDKPLIAIVITHGHPDHYNGNSVLLAQFPDIPIISTQGISDCICDSVDAKEIKWKPFFGEQWPSQKILPNQMVSDGSTLILDGLAYHFCDLGAAESSSDLYVTLGQQRAVVFVGDVVFNQMHGFMNDGHSARWLAVLKQLSQALAGVELLFTGHGEPGQPQSLIATQIEYVTTYRNQVAELANGADKLSIEQKAQLEKAMTVAFPHHQLTAFIQAGADSVAAELHSELSIACSPN